MFCILKFDLHIQNTIHNYKNKDGVQSTQQKGKDYVNETSYSNHLCYQLKKGIRQMKVVHVVSTLALCRADKTNNSM